MSLLADTFTTDTSGNYTTSGTWAYDGSNHTLNVSAGSAAFAVQNVSQSDSLTALCSVYITTAGDTENKYVGLQITANTTTAGGNRGYIAAFRGTHTTEIWLLDSNIAWVASGSFNWTTNTKYWLKIYRNGTNVKVKVWTDGGTEPNTWNIDTTVASRSDTYAGFAASDAGGGSPAARFDDLLVENGLMASPSPSRSVSPTPSISVSLSPSVSVSLSPSVSVSLSQSLTPSSSISLSPSVSVSLSPSVSESKSASLSPSVSVSLSPSTSTSLSPSVSASLSPSLSVSLTPSLSLSATPSASPSNTPSVSESRSNSPSTSATASLSPSVSASISVSPSLGPPGNIYTREAKVALPTTHDHLSTEYTTAEEYEVYDVDGETVCLSGAASRYLIHQFQKLNDNVTDYIKIKVDVTSTLAASSKTIYLQLWNHRTEEWITIDSNSSKGANEAVALYALITTTPQIYYDFGNHVTARIYQQNDAVGTQTLCVDRAAITFQIPYTNKYTSATSVYQPKYPHKNSQDD